MAKKLKKTLALLLTLSMLTGILGTAAFAAEGEEILPESQVESVLPADEGNGNTEETPAEAVTETPAAAEEPAEAVEPTEEPKDEAENGEPVADEEPSTDEEIALVAEEEEETELPAGASETALETGVSITGIAGLNGLYFDTMENAYNAVKDILQKMDATQGGEALNQGQLQPDYDNNWQVVKTAQEKFDEVYTQKTDLSGHSGAKLTWTVFGKVNVPDTLDDLFLSGGRQAAYYGSDSMTIREIEVVGGNENAELILSKAIKMPYQWWGDPTDGHIFFSARNVGLTLNNENTFFIDAVHIAEFDCSVINCSIKGKLYHYFNGPSALTVENCTFEPNNNEAYALMAQGHVTEPLTVNFKNNTVSGYTRGINIDQVTADVTVAGNTITPGTGYSAVQVSGCAVANISDNTIHCNGGNVLTLHAKLAQNKVDDRTITLQNNIVDGEGYLIYDDVAASNKGNANVCVNLVMANNNLADTIDIAHGIKGSTVLDTPVQLVAEVNGVQYSSLQAAIDAAPAGAAVVVLRDTDEDITLPLESITLTSESETKPVLTGKVRCAKDATAEGAQVTIENLAFENTYIHLMGWGENTGLNKMGGLTIRNNIFAGTPNEAGSIYAIHINNGDMAVNNLTITGNVFTNCGTGSGGCVYATACGNLVVTGNEFRNSTMNALTLIGKDSTGNKTASAVISNNVFDGWACSPEDRIDGRAMRLSNFEHDMDLTNNSFVSTNLPEEYIKLTGLADGKKADVNKCYWGGEAPAEDKLLGVGTVFAYYADAEMTQLVVSDGIVAEVSGMYYTTLQGAVNAAGEGDIVKLLDDITVNSDNTSDNSAAIEIPAGVTLDGGGHTMTAGTFTPTLSQNKGTHMLGVGATGVTIKNLIVDMGHVVNSKHALNVYDGADVTLVNVTLKNANAAGMVVNGSTVTATDLNTSGNVWGAVNVDKNSKFRLVSGTLTEDNKIWVDDEESTITVPEDWDWVQIGERKFYNTGLSIRLDQTTAALYSNTTPNTITLTLTVPEGAKVEWTTSNAAVAAVENGVVTAVGRGTADITATVGSMEATCAVTVSTYTDPYVPPYVPPTPNEELSENDTPLVEKPFLFADVLERDWFYSDVKTMFNRGVIGGMTETAYEPYTNATRGMVATLLYRMAGSPSVEGLDVTVADVADDDWFYEAAVWAYATGVFNGYGDGSFRGEEEITREQLSAVLNRYAAAQGTDVTASTELTGFADADRVSGWAMDAVKWAVAVGLINGREGSLDAWDFANRAELATVLVRFDKLLTADED